MTEYTNLPGVTKHKEDEGDYNTHKKKEKKRRQPVELEPEPTEVRHNDLWRPYALIVTFFFSLRKKSAALMLWGVMCVLMRI
jgi:hypothetical protein